MADFTDLFNTCIDAVAEMLVMFHFFTKCLLSKAKPVHYFAFTLISIVILYLFRDYRLLQYVFCAIILIMSGISLYRTKCMRVILYAAATITAMQLCYGIIGSLSTIIYSFFPAEKTAAVTFALSIGGNIASLTLSVFCYKIILKYCALDETINEQYNIIIVLIPALTILFAAQYINFAVYGNSSITDGGKFYATKNFLMLISVC